MSHESSQPRTVTVELSDLFVLRRRVEVSIPTDKCPGCGAAVDGDAEVKLFALNKVDIEGSLNDEGSMDDGYTEDLGEEALHNAVKMGCCGYELAAGTFGLRSFIPSSAPLHRMPPCPVEAVFSQPLEPKRKQEWRVSVAPSGNARVYKWEPGQRSAGKWVYAGPAMWMGLQLVTNSDVGSVEVLAGLSAAVGRKLDMLAFVAEAHV